MRDNNTILQASVTKTGTFNGTGLDTKEGTPRRGIPIKIAYSAAATSSGTGFLGFSVDVSADNSAWAVHNTANLLALTTTPQAGEINIIYESSQRYVRVSINSISGTGSTITYDAGFDTAKP